MQRIRASLVGLRMPRALEALDHTLRRLERSGRLAHMVVICWEDQVADVEPWTTTFNPGTSTLERLVELTHEFVRYNRVVHIMRSQIAEVLPAGLEESSECADHESGNQCARYTAKRADS